VLSVVVIVQRRSLYLTEAEPTVTGLQRPLS